MVKPESQLFIISIPGRITSCILTVLLFFAGYSSALCQKITSQTPVISGDSIIISYDLEGLVSSQLFEVRAYSSFNQSDPLKTVSGDVGKNIRPGKNRKIIWLAKNELKNYKGDLRISLVAEVLFTPFENFKISEAKKLVRGRTYKLTWEGGEQNKEVNIALRLDERIILSKKNQANIGMAEMMIPKNMKPGGKYNLRLSMENDPGNQYQIHNIGIRRKIPTGVKILGVAAIGAVTYLIIPQGSGEEPQVNPANNNLPVAPDRPK
jgi:hypothetical protein